MSAARALLLALALALPRPGLADMCPAADLIGPGMIDRICWSCLFPLRLGGVTLIGSALATGGRDANGFALSSRPGVPARAATDPVCLCDTGALPIAGVSSGMWMPTTLYEPTLKPGCAPVLGGIDLGVSDPLYLGSSGGTEGDLTQQSFNHMHSYSYPVLHLMELFTRCGHSHADIDLLYLSEIDPSWNDPILALYGTPLSAFGTSRAAVAACPADAVAAALGRPIDSLFWCGGSWSTTLAPYTGFAHAQGPVQYTASTALRLLALNAARGITRDRVGNAALCQAQYAPMIRRSHYRWQIAWPRAEAGRNHASGESLLRWGAGRWVPGGGEQPIALRWDWIDCCSPILGGRR